MNRKEVKDLSPKVTRCIRKRIPGMSAALTNAVSAHSRVRGGRMPGRYKLPEELTERLRSAGIEDLYLELRPKKPRGLLIAFPSER